MSKHPSQRWRNKIKQTLIQAYGNKCVRCGYDVCKSALCFHHLDPSQKDNTIANMLKNPRKLSLIIDEAKKCTLLCANCHLELHEGLWNIDTIETNFDSSLFNKPAESKSPNKCKYCTKPTFNKFYCSRKCMGYSIGSKNLKGVNVKSKYKEDIIDLRSQGLTYKQIIECLGCSKSTVIRCLSNNKKH